MDHSEALETMAAERYLLGELSQENREAFEAHFFDCQDCALDLRAAAAFVEGAKSQLPRITESTRARPSSPALQSRNWRRWFTQWQPSFAAPAFALLLGVVAYQNLATIPALRSASRQPLLLPWATLHVGTRGPAHAPVLADRKHGLVLLIDLPDAGTYQAFMFELKDAQGTKLWAQTAAPPSQDGADTTPLSLLVPASGLQQGSYTLTITGITAQGHQTQLGRRNLDIRFTD